MYLDVNFLKETNDYKGHEAGDQLLIGVAKVLTENPEEKNEERTTTNADQQVIDVAQVLIEDSRETDAFAHTYHFDGQIDSNHVVSRWGGDEYGVLLRGTDTEGAKQFWARKSPLFKARGISIGAGVVEVDPSKLTSHEAIVQELAFAKSLADKALYEAKAQSKATGTCVMISAEEFFQAPQA